MAQAWGMLYTLAFYSFALFNWSLYLAIAVYNKSFFKKDTEQDKLQLAIARDKYWNLSKCPIPSFFHRFYTLRNGLKLHYIINRDGHTRSNATAQENLAIFLHGFPDTCMEWRQLLQSEAALRLSQAIVVCVDLPGYGGSDGFDHSGPDEILEALTEFVIAMRETYLDDGSENSTFEEQKTYIVAHDWGCVLAFRLASEAACLADRFILMNGPHPELALANKDRLLKSATKIFKQFQQSPWKHRGCLAKAFYAIRPLLYQLVRFGYIAAFHLPSFMVKYLGVGGNLAFLRAVQMVAYKPRGEYNPAESMACCLGPGLEECKTQTPGPGSDTYGKTVVPRAGSPGMVFLQQTAYYRDGAAVSHWTKSLETIADLHSIELNNQYGSPFRRRSSSGASALFDPPYKGSLRAPTTILWGKNDRACSQAICLDGIGDYLARGSEVVLLPNTGHWAPVEKGSREAVATVLDWFVVQGNVVGDVGGMVKQVYEGAIVLVRK